MKKILFSSILFVLGVSIQLKAQRFRAGISIGPVITDIQGADTRDFDNDFYTESLPYFLNSLPGITRREKFVKDIGEEYFEKASFKESLEMFNKYIALSLGSPDSYLKRGLAYYNLGDYENAKADFEKVISLDPENSIAKEYLGK